MGEGQSGKTKRRRLTMHSAQRCQSGLLLLHTAACQAIASEVRLIFLDWDDTLLPSTWLQQQGLQITSGSELPNKEQKSELKKVARGAIKILRRARRFGHAMIVTNAEKGWVELTCSKFMPEVVP